ncbi:MAG: hypothetical protein BWY77_01177 [bacterium ADurb.Bin431]|nr:MAG: hypothetical protein BWY77_01177 [bacterium ADurb.Bin431]
MLLDDVAVPFDGGLFVPLGALVVGQLQFDHRDALDLQLLGEQEREGADSPLVILEQTLGFAQLVGRLGFKILVWAGLDGAAERGYRLLILLELDPALPQPVKGHRPDEPVIRLFGRPRILLGGGLIVALFKIERAELILRRLADSLGEAGVEGDVAELFFGRVEFTHREQGLAEQDLGLGDELTAGIELDDLFELAFGLGILTTVKEALPDHDQGVVHPAAFRIILEDAGGLFDRLLVILHLARGRFVRSGTGGQLPPPPRLLLFLGREFHDLCALALLALLGGVVKKLLGIIESIIIGATAEENQRQAKEG